VTPPSKMPVAVGDFVKTDKRDAKALSCICCRAVLLKSVPVPDKRKREDRDLLRTRDQLVNQRKRIFLQIQSKLRFHGIPIRNRLLISRKNRKMILEYPGMGSSLREAFQLLLDSYDYYNGEPEAGTKSGSGIKRRQGLSRWRSHLKRHPRVGLLTALSFLLEFTRTCALLTAMKKSAAISG